jgi:hypothetical protein
MTVQLYLNLDCPGKVIGRLFAAPCCQHEPPVVTAFNKLGP